MVAYGETVAAAKENAVYTPPSEFIDYEGLKEEVYRAPSAEAASLLTHISGGSAAKRGERFISQLHVEMDKASCHVRARVSVIVGILANVLREAGKAEPASAELARLTQVTEDASAQIVELMKYVEICRTACRKATKKFDKVQRTSLGSWLVAQLALQPFCNVSLEPLIVMLSDGFASLRAASNPPKTDAEGRPIEWVPPSDFERSTTKYWVKMESVPELTARVLKHLSILIMGRTPPTLAQMAEGAPVLMHPEYAQAIYSKFYEGTSVLSWITSLYLDSLSFRQYHERLARDDGANLFRLRWYGLDPEQAGTVYVERKTHRSKDSGEKSTKQRLPIAPSAVRDLLHPERALDVAAQLDAQLAAGAISEKQRDKGVALGAEVQAALAERGLLPAVRTVYQRTAFQASDSNSVRLTLDSNLSLIKEALALGDAEAPAAVHEWCRNLSEPLDPAHILPFPFAVLEVKLQDETPAWVEELVASELLLPMAKFSKYLTGCAALHTGAVETLPYWFEEPAVKEALASQPLEGASYSLAAVRDLSLPNGISCSATDDAVPNGAVALEIKPQLRRFGAGELLVDEEHAPAAIAGRRLSTRAHTATATPHGSPPAVNAARPWPAVRLWSFSASKTVPKRGVAKVDPKTFFALERTFIQWLSVGMLLFTIGVALMETAERGSLSPGGLVVLACSAMLILYGLTNFYRRVRKLSRRDSSGYVDRCGPAILAAMLLGAAATYVVVYTLKRNEQGGGGAAMCALSTDLAAATDLLAQDEFREAAAKLDEAGLPLAGLQGALPDTSLINSLLEAAGVQPPGARLAIINALSASSCETV